MKHVLELRVYFLHQDLSSSYTEKHSAPTYLSFHEVHVFIMFVKKRLKQYIEFFGQFSWFWL